MLRAAKKCHAKKRNTDSFVGSFVLELGGTTHEAKDTVVDARLLYTVQETFSRAQTVAT
jgi:hypothetical protein